MVHWIWCTEIKPQNNNNKKNCGILETLHSLGMTYWLGFYKYFLESQCFRFFLIQIVKLKRTKKKQNVFYGDESVKTGSSA